MGIDGMQSAALRAGPNAPSVDRSPCRLTGETVWFFGVGDSAHAPARFLAARYSTGTAR